VALFGIAPVISYLVCMSSLRHIYLLSSATRGVFFAASNLTQMHHFLRNLRSEDFPSLPQYDSFYKAFRKDGSYQVTHRARQWRVDKVPVNSLAKSAASTLY